MAIQVAIEGYGSLEQIGVGGMAAVYRARQISIDKIVAIKVLFPYLATDESYIERFQREAKAAASIQHENIVNVIDCGESDGAFYMVMEYYDGRTLEQLMKERPGLPPEIAIQILLEVAYGLEAAHAADIVHRDIKPANIIYTNQGGIKIADFGLARKSDALTMITQHGKVIGTPAYMSPEQAAGDPVGPASDIFSFGVVAYELLGRKKPFDGRTYSEVLDQIQTHNPEPVSIANPLVAPEFERIVMRALTKEQSARYARASELIADLEAAMDKNHMVRDRRRLVSYAKDPDKYDASFKDHTISQCMSRGAFYMQKGKTHIDDAVLEYRRVLFLEPDHKRARAGLVKLGVDDANTPPTAPRIDAETEHEKTREMASSGVSSKPKKKPVQVPRPRRWIIAGCAVLVAAGSALAWRIISSGPDPNGVETHATNSSALTTRPGATNSVPNVAAKPMEPRMAASTGDASGPLPVLGDQTPGKSGRKEITGPQKKAQGTTTPVTKGKEPRPLASDLGKDEGGTKVATGDRSTTTSPPAPLPEPGSLSVFFLGGIGELWIDGKLFAQQPPFEKVNIAAGTHRVVCKMEADASSHAFNVEIKPGRNTVIEYEVGGEPVVTTE